MADSPFVREQSVAVLGAEATVFEAGSGTELVLLHGNPDTHHAWEPVVSRLAPRLRCLAPDLPGYGKTPMPEGFDFSVERQGAWVAALLDGLKLEKVHLAVHDVGGIYGLSFAAQWPARLRSLTIFNTSFFPETPWHFWARVWRMPMLGEVAMALGNKALFVRETLRGGPKMPRAYAEAAYDHYTMATRKQVLRWYRAMTYPVVLQGWDQRLLTAIASVPRQVLWGERDPFIPGWVPARFSAPLHRYPDCGHWVMLEDPDSASARIAELVSSAG